MKLLLTYKKEILLVVLLTIAYFFLRTYNILHLPIFTDEAIYVRWSQIARQDAAERFISLSDGKQPMYVWVAMVFMRFIHDPLLAGRLVSVASGFATAIGMFFLTRELFKNRWIALLAVGIYVIFPFTLVYDRMAMYDSMVSTFIIWGIYIEVLLVRKIRLDLAFIAALVIGAGMLVKTNTFFNLYFLPLTVLLFDFKQKNAKKQLLRWILYIAITAILANVYYSILRLSPLYGIINEKNHTFYYSMHDWLQHPIAFFAGNLHGLLDWFITYVGWIPFVFIVGSIFVFRKFWREKVLLIIWFVPPILGLALLGKVLYPRYILPMVVPLLPLAAVSLWFVFTKYKNVGVKVLAVLLFATLYLRTDYYILTDFAHAPIPKPDLVQYVNSWPAGGGIKESIAFFEQQAQKGPIFIATQGTFGLMPFSIQIYLQDKPNITIEGFWPIGRNLPQDVNEASKKKPTYFVFYQPCVLCTNVESAPLTWNVKEIMRIKKGIGPDYYTVYQVIPPVEK